MQFSSSTQELVQKAKTVFNEERYEEAEKFVSLARPDIESKRSELSVVNSLRRETFGFIQQNWLYILLVLMFLGFITYLAYSKINKTKLKNKIIKMKAELNALHDLMKKAQEDRFNKNSISGLVYNIRIKKYQQREQEIKQDLPVLEKRLQDLIRKR